MENNSIFYGIMGILIALVIILLMMVYSGCVRSVYLGEKEAILYHAAYEQCKADHVKCVQDKKYIQADLDECLEKGDDLLICP